MTVITMVPLMGGVALSVDYSELLRQKHATLNALDAAGLATAQQVVSGATDDAARAYAKTFFETNLGPVDPANTSLTVTLPNSNAGGGTLKLCSALTYHPYFCRPPPCCWAAGPPAALQLSRIDRKSVSRTRWKSLWCSTIPAR